MGALTTKWQAGRVPARWEPVEAYSLQVGDWAFFEGKPSMVVEVTWDDEDPDYVGLMWSDTYGNRAFEMVPTDSIYGYLANWDTGGIEWIEDESLWA
jgi:hypothetical protein